jgi:hypothetical protein
VNDICPNQHAYRDAIRTAIHDIPLPTFTEGHAHMRPFFRCLRRRDWPKGIHEHEGTDTEWDH